MQLLTGVPRGLGRGTHTLTIRIGTGTAQLQYAVDGIAMEDVPDSTYTANADENKSLPECQVQVILTGDATAYIGLVENGYN